MTQPQNERASVSYFVDLERTENLWRTVCRMAPRMEAQGHIPLYWSMGRGVYDALKADPKLKHDWVVSRGFLTRDQAARGVPADVVSPEGVIRELDGLPVLVGGPDAHLTLYGDGCRARVGTTNV